MSRFLEPASNISARLFTPFLRLFFTPFRENHDFYAFIEPLCEPVLETKVPVCAGVGSGGGLRRVPVCAGFGFRSRFRKVPEGPVRAGVGSGGSFGGFWCVLV